MISEDYDHKWTQHIVSPKNTKLPVYNEAAQRQEEKRSGGFWTERFFSSKTMTINLAHIQWDTTCDYSSIESLCDSIVRLAKERSEQLLNSDTCETNLLQATASFDETLIEASTTPSKEVKKKRRTRLKEDVLNSTLENHVNQKEKISCVMLRVERARWNSDF